MNEVWKIIDGFEGLYEVSNLGRVKSLYDGRHMLFREKILKPGKDSKGRLMVNLCKDGTKKKFLVHRLVAMAFVGGYFDGAVINHVDHNPQNNVAENLEWTTQKNNCSREKSFSPEISKKLYSKRVLQYTMSGELVKEWPSIHEIERQLGFNRGNICLVCNGQRKSAYGFIWRYQD